MRFALQYRLLVGIIMAISICTPISAERVTVAVATNFLVPAQDIAAAFEAETGHDVRMVHGSTGRLFAQIIAGAPFDVFLSADVTRPALLVEQGYAEPENWKTYAFGRLVLVHGAGTKSGVLDEVLSRANTRIAIADPAIAPYGLAARHVLQQFRGGEWADGVVFGESVGQTFSFVATGNVDFGLVALSQERGFEGALFSLEIPNHLHPLIQQDTVILRHAHENPAARAFFNFLSSSFAIQSLERAGYDVPE